MKNLLIILTALIVFSACRKEERIDRNLWNHGGKWDVEQSDTKNYENGELVSTDHGEDVGTIVFREDGSGTILVKLGDDFSNGMHSDFDYVVNKEDELVMILSDEIGMTMFMDMEWKKNSLKLHQKQSDLDEVDSYSVSDLVLKKRK